MSAENLVIIAEGIFDICQFLVIALIAFNTMPNKNDKDGEAANDE